VKTLVTATLLLGALEGCSLVLGLDDAEFDPALETSTSRDSAAGAGGESAPGAGGSSPDPNAAERVESTEEAPE
jgi:hypothetical protein